MSRTSALASPCEASFGSPTASTSLRAEPVKLRPVTDLHCYICSLTPSFTNTSHLLTHLASKTHLRTLFERELCATQCGDEDCAKALEKFHTWYYDENVGEHLVDRFIIKKGKWSREKIKHEVGEPSEEVQENIMVNDTQTLLQQNRENVDDRGIAEVLIRSMNEDKKRKREEFSTPNRRDSRLTLDGSFKHSPLNTGTVRNVGGRRPLASLVNEAPTRTGQQPVEEQAPLLYNNTPPSESSLSSIKGEARTEVSVMENASEDETDIIEGPDRGVIYSPRGPRLRGKIWPGMSVFDIARSTNVSPAANNTTSGFVSLCRASPCPMPVKENESRSPDLVHQASPSPGQQFIPDLPGGAQAAYMSEARFREAAQVNATINCGSDISAKRLELTSVPFIDNGVDLSADVGSRSDLDADGEIDDDFEYLLRERLAKVNESEPMTLFEQQTDDGVNCNTLYDPPYASEDYQRFGNASAVDIEFHTHRSGRTPEPQLGQWQPINRLNHDYSRIEPTRTKHAMAIGSLINEVDDQEVSEDVHVAHHMNLDTLNQAYVNLSGS